jgi:hypothetical protein
MSVPQDGSRIWSEMKAHEKLDRIVLKNFVFRLIGTATATWDPASLNDGAGETSSGITVTGAAVGDIVLVAPPYDMQDIVYCGYVQAANTVEIRIQNESGGVINLGSGSWGVAVFRLS